MNEGLAAMTDRAHAARRDAASTRECDAGRRRLLGGLAALAGAALAPRAVGAEEAWPNAMIRIIVPFAPGGPADGSARILADVMAPKLGQPMAIENRAGGGGIVGIATAAQSHDRHTLLMGSTSMTIMPTLQPKGVTFDILRDFDPIGMVSAQPLVVVVPATSRIVNIDGLIQVARANPGQLSAANSGNGSLAHLTTELFCIKAGISITSVPYRGESLLTPDLLAGTVSLGFLNLPAMLPLIRNGRLRALAVTAPEPIPELPRVPTLRSLGIAGVEAEGWAALLAPKGIPEAGLAMLERTLAEALQSAPVRERFATFGVRPVVSSRAGLRDFIAAETERWGEVIRTRGIKAAN
jgi:tripartite-type tricarboxylate transporter receptor subunit TctC